MNVYLETYGCQMNVSDSEVALSILRAAGYERCKEIADADVILINTCSVRDNAELRVLGRLDVFMQEKKKRKQKSKKSKAPDGSEKRGPVIGVLGCMGQRLKEKLLENPAVDFVAGPDTYRNLPDVIKAIIDNGEKISATNLSPEETYADINPMRTDTNGVSTFISITRGCNNMCSYCIVPYTRGRERSRDPQSIVHEAEELFKQGYKEVTLLGQNVDSYQWTNPDDPTDTTCFYQLLELVALVDPNLRVRFQTNHPKDIRKGVLYTMAMYSNICNHIHLPVQSGSNAMLQKMNRKYTREEYLQKIADIREVLPDCAITTDIIAGFCGETEEDHKQTLSLLKEVGFDGAFMFQYSQRPNTLAARKFKDDISAAEKTKRLNEIIELQSSFSLMSNKKDVGETYEVLVEGFSKRSDKQMTGRTQQNKMCVFDVPQTLANGKKETAVNIKPGDYVDVKINSCTSATLIGEIIQKPNRQYITAVVYDNILDIRNSIRELREKFEKEFLENRESKKKENKK
ncbi:MAG: tRNA (N6-isopentenyl adenosine(37)-C2)-methylthiotransferase MiaB [Bacteroidales bacterium]|nr:tRNA (N6-isopentenyl adenosine(37)-C2)-methylthiotransferase MiaB [Bacteroidales bacterium]MDD4420131.1 tRNA (N6-isopentenyl adenosine(37)-C2)-methylthiotransferase MiaB [Bacteroidales bacterium]